MCLSGAAPSAQAVDSSLKHLAVGHQSSATDLISMIRLLIMIIMLITLCESQFVQSVLANH